MHHLAKPIKKLINELVKLPGIGPKTAQRLSLYLVKATPRDCEDLAHSIVEMKSKVKQCKKCWSFTDSELCGICADDARAKDILCVVAEPQDIFVIESSREYKGVYHVLGGNISPMDGIGPDRLKVKELISRIKQENIKEIIIATSLHIQGEATAMYINRAIRDIAGDGANGIKITRIAAGIPMGADIEYADEYTIAKAMEGRRDY